MISLNFPKKVNNLLRICENTIGFLVFDKKTPKTILTEVCRIQQALSGHQNIMLNRYNRILKIEIFLHKLIICLIGLMLTQASVQAQQDQNIGISGSSLNPHPTTVGGSVKACFNFVAPNGVTLNIGSAEAIEFSVCFNKVTLASIASSVPQITYGLGSNGFIDMFHNPTFSANCWTGKITQNLNLMSSAKICLDGLSASTPVTPSQANNNEGVGFIVNLTPHSRDPSTGDEDDEEEIYTYTSEKSSDLLVKKIVSQTIPRVGDSVEFLVIATNNGPDNDQNVTITDQLPSGYTLTGASATNGSWNSPVWTLGDLVNGKSDTLKITATVLNTGDYKNTATIEGSNPDPDTTNNSSSVNPTPIRPAVALVKTGVLSQDKNTITYTFTVVNTGDTTLSDITITDPLIPAVVTLDKSTLASGEHTSGTAIYLVSDTEKSLGKVTNTASVLATPPDNVDVSDISGTAIDNDTETVVIIPPDCNKCLTSKAKKIK